MLFHEIKDAVAIIARGGVFRQVKVYQRKRRVYIQFGSGYAYVCRQGTSVPKLRVDDIALPFEPEYHSLGYMMVPESYNGVNVTKKEKKNAS